MTPRAKEYMKKKMANSESESGQARLGPNGKASTPGKQNETNTTNTNKQSTKHSAQSTKHAGTGGHRPEGIDSRDRVARWGKVAAAVQYSIRHESHHALGFPLLDFSSGGFASPVFGD